jgi:nitrite reductase (NADH) small subunit
MSTWKTICKIEDIPENGGCCALLGQQQVAIFRVDEGAATETFYAIDNHDPFSRANVLSRGIVGSLSDTVVVASPIYKHHFCLKTGQCLEDDVQLRTWRVRAQGNDVQLAG